MSWSSQGRYIVSKFRLLTADERNILQELLGHKLMELTVFGRGIIPGTQNAKETIRVAQAIALLTGRLFIDDVVRVERGLPAVEDTGGMEFPVATFLQAMREDDARVGYYQGALESYSEDEETIDPNEEYSEECERCGNHERCMVWRREHGLPYDNAHHPENEGSDVKLPAGIRALLDDLGIENVGLA